MRAIRVLALWVFALALCAAQAHADNILYFNDLSLGTDRMGQALTSLSGTHTTTTASSPTDFLTKLTTQSFDLAIFFQQNNQGATYDAAIAGLGTYIDGGGRGILADWTQNNVHAAAFDATFTGNENQTAVTVSNPTLGAGITNPITLSNPGWGIFSTGLGGGNVAATFANAEGAIVIGNSGRSILNGFLSDTFVNGPQGVQLYVNEIGFLLDGAAAVPTPIAAPAGLGLIGLIVARRRTRAKLDA